jgi:hypothetical protein
MLDPDPYQMHTDPQPCSLKPSIYINLKFTEAEPLHNEVKGESLVSYDQTDTSRQGSLKFITDSVHLITVDCYFGFCGLLFNIQCLSAYTHTVL